jgi:DNA-binding CsgD family transcriptional regulator
VAEGGAHLLERVDELAVMEGSLRAARAGVGAVVYVEGPPGIGKTALLTATIARASRRRMRVLSARAGELEMSFPYAVVRQIFEPVMAQAAAGTRHTLLSGAAAHAASVVDPHAQPVAAPVDPSAVLHGLYWLTVNLAADAPVVLVVDDLHWSDPTSASWLAYLARRIRGLPVAMILAARPIEPGADDTLLERWSAIAGLTRVQPAPLSRAAVDDLARTNLGEPVEQAFSAACHAATAGNPFYVTELLRALRHDRIQGVAASVRAIDGLTPGSVVEATLARLHRMPVEARSVAEAVALLEPTAELHWIAELTGLAVDVVAGAADSLLEAGFLRSVAPCRFEHPILRSAVLREITPGRRGRMRLKAARALAAAGMSLDAVAAHLLQTPGSGERWVVSVLEQAAEQASVRGAPASAVAYLERALAEPPAASQRRKLLLALGTAENQTQRPQAASHLREALALAEHPDQAATAALWLGQALFHTGAFDEACQAMTEVVERFEDHVSQPMLELQAYLLSIAVMSGRTAETAPRAAALEARALDASPVARAVQATLAFREVVAGVPRDRVRERLCRALVGTAGSEVLGSHASQRQAPEVALIWIDDLDRAEELFTELIKGAARGGRRQSFEIFSAMRGYAMRLRGDLADAAADIEPILAATPQGKTLSLARLVALITQVQLLVDAGRPDAAEDIARAAAIPATSERLPLLALLRHAQAVAQLAHGRFGEAATTLAAVGEVCEASGIRSPVVVPWRSNLALALAGTPRHDEGIELVRVELGLADRCNVERARGVALRALGMLEGGAAGLRHLEAAVHALERSPARLELGWACCELGSALRRANRRREARAPLDRALDLALASGAQLLAQRASEQLQALGARPRSVPLTGLEALTPSERRVCRMAAKGLKNAEIAQALFVSLTTVETHLRSAYRKLDISTRTELPQTLAAPH